jgi:DNA-binding HxlR family transcriptional regulator
VKADVSKRGDIRGRAGTRALTLLGTSPNAAVLQALGEGPSSLAELQSRGGSPGSTLRARLKDLVRDGVVVARRNRGFPRGSAEYELTVAGDELLPVVEILGRWLAESPKGSLAFGGDAAKAAIGALVEAWSASLLRALAAKPLSVADLDSLIGALNYPSLERRIAAMRHAGQVEARPANGRETPYAVTAWLRRGVAPLLAAVGWERRHLNGGGVPVAAMDVEAALLLAMPLVELDPELSGSCRLAVELPSDGERRVAGVLATLERGAVASCTSRLDGSADAWASGTLGVWLRALIDRDGDSLELGGDGRLARTLVTGLNEALFAKARQRDQAFA